MLWIWAKINKNILPLWRKHRNVSKSCISRIYRKKTRWPLWTIGNNNWRAQAIRLLSAGGVWRKNRQRAQWSWMLLVLGPTQWPVYFRWSTLHIYKTLLPFAFLWPISKTQCRSSFWLAVIAFYREDLQVPDLC